jgi:tetratricopeptide (TPR) repeat protein
VALALCFAGAPATAQESSGARTAAGPAAEKLSTGVVIPQVVLQSDPSQSYALYLPTAYTPAKRWPVLYAFDPGGEGTAPVELIYKAAEQRGWIVAGSNSSHNGPAADQLRAAEAMWNDVRTRFAVDEKQSYAAGFSGGSRAAFTFADSCRCIQGVIAVGAGLPPLAGTLRSLPFVVFMTVGEYDFNYPEMVALEQKLDEIHVPNRLRRFDGTHQWPPPAILAEAADWMDVQAMRQGRRAKDDAFLADQARRVAERAHEDQAAGDLRGAYEEYRKGAEEFAGAADAAEFARHAGEMKGSPGFQRAEKQEREDIARQKRLADEIVAALATMPGSNVEIDRRRTDIEPRVTELREDARRAKNPRDVRVLRRALADIFATAIETGSVRRRQGAMAEAEACFEIAAAAMPEEPGPPFGLARIYAQSGQKKQALKALDRAVANGLKDPALLREVPEFASLRQEPHFQELLARLTLEEKINRP